jgi:putative ABC transport system permease protein
MNISEAVRIALFSLWANKLRSFLTLLGIVIGVSAVIAVVTFESGINGYVAEKIFNLGADVFIVSKMGNVVTDPEQFIEGNKRKDVTMEQFQAIAQDCTGCTIVGASVRNFNGKVVYGTQSSTDISIPAAR